MTSLCVRQKRLTMFLRRGNKGNNVNYGWGGSSVAVLVLIHQLDIRVRYVLIEV